MLSDDDVCVGCVVVCVRLVVAAIAKATYPWATRLLSLALALISQPLFKFDMRSLTATSLGLLFLCFVSLVQGFYSIPYLSHQFQISISF